MFLLPDGLDSAQTQTPFRGVRVYVWLWVVVIIQRRREGRAEADIKPLANGLQLGPGVRAAHLQWWAVGKDVVAQVFQRGLGICGGKLRGVFNLLPHLDIDLLQEPHQYTGCYDIV